MEGLGEPRKRKPTRLRVGFVVKLEVRITAIAAKKRYRITLYLL